MNLPSDENGLFIQGMQDTQELGKYLERKYTQDNIQDAYAARLEESKRLAKAENITPLQGFWKLLDWSYSDKTSDLKCGAGCAHCCHTGVAATQVEWDGIVDHARKTGLDLNRIIQRAQKTVDKIKRVLDSKKNLDSVEWHRLVINQPCPFLNEEQICEVYDDRPLDCRLVVAYRDVCDSKNLEHAQRGVHIEEAIGSTVVAKLQHDQTPKMLRGKFKGEQKLRLLQHWLILWQKKTKKKKNKK